MFTENVNQKYFTSYKLNNGNTTANTEVIKDLF